MAYIGRSLLKQSSITTLKRTIINSRFLSSQASVKMDVEVLPNISKSLLDKREYRGIKLKNNLKVLLVSDPETDISAASLSVQAGSLMDPKDIQGLAHFCEHMLFLGTDSYPEENEYSKFLNEHGGSSNAYTASDHTNYYFDVAPDALQGALDRFASFFVCPRFTETASEREVNAVHSEHDKNISSDLWRKHQLESVVANPSHPYSLFATGNRDTLWTNPRKNNVDVRSALLAYYNNHYSANIMNLAVLGNQCLDSLQSIVVPLFSKISNKNVEGKLYENAYSNEQLGFWVNWVPIKDIRTLSVMFPIPDTSESYRTSAERYLSHLIGHEGPGSLLSLLKKNNWVNNLSAGPERPAKGFSVFKINVDLSPEGLTHTEDILTHMFQYLEMLRRSGPQQWIWEELRDINAFQFRCKDKERPQQYVSHLTSALFEYPMEDVLSAGYILTEYKPELITQILGEMIPRKSIVFHASQELESKANLTEQYYGVKYSKEPIPLDSFKKFESCGVHPELKLPQPNEFIPTKFDLKEREEDRGIVPRVLKETALSRVWFLQDNEFKLPKGHAKLEIYNALPLVSPFNYNLMHLFTASIKDELTEETYSAAMTGLNYSIGETMYGLEILVHGYDQKLDLLVNKIIKKILNFNFKPDRFEVLKELYVRNLKNWNDEQPYSHALFNFKYILSEKRWSHAELLENVEGMTLERLIRFAEDFILNLRLEWLIHGNFTTSEAENLVEQVENDFKSKGAKPLLPSQAARLREIKLPDGSSYMYSSDHLSHQSSCSSVLFQTGIVGTRNNVLLELFDHIANEPCFNQLRTVEQLGYVVLTTVRRSIASQGFQILVQCDRHPAYVESRIENFLNKLEETLQNMSQEDFEVLKQGLVTRKIEKPKTLNDRALFLWNEIHTQQYNFERQKVEVADLETVSKQDLLEFFNEYVAISAPKRRRLGVQVISMVEAGAGRKQTDLDGPGFEEVKSTRIEDLNNFKQQMELYPAINPFNQIPNESKSKL